MHRRLQVAGADCRPDLSDERAAAPAEASATAPAGEAPRSYFARAAQAEAPAHEAPAAQPLAHAPSLDIAAPAPTPVAAAPVAPAPAPAPAAAAPAPAPAGLPKVSGFALPVDTLAGLAGAAGLQWVNSDADKVAAVQAAIAAEPAPIHVPRERPPAVELDDGPLVLVETRKDLGKISLPFEQAPH